MANKNLDTFNNIANEANKDAESRDRHNCYDVTTTALSKLQHLIKRVNRHGRICTPQPGSVDDLHLTKNEVVSRIISDNFKKINQEEAFKIVNNGGKVMVLYISETANDYHVMAVGKNHALDKGGPRRAKVRNYGLKEIIKEGDIVISGQYYVLYDHFFIPNEKFNLKKDIQCATTLVE